MIVEYIIYKRNDYRFVWGIYSINRNIVIYIPSKKKKLGINTLNEFFEQYLQKNPYVLHTLPETRHPDDSLLDKIRHFENDENISEVYEIGIHESCSDFCN